MFHDCSLEQVNEQSQQKLQDHKVLVLHFMVSIMLSTLDEQFIRIRMSDLFPSVAGWVKYQIFQQSIPAVFSLQFRSTK